jgi:hypothetical protein
MFDYDTPVPEFSSAGHGGALGARIMIVEGLHGLVNVTRRPSAPYGPNVTATDVALTYTVRYPK